MDTKTYLSIALIAAVLVVSVVQAFQINEINKKLSTTGLVTASGNTATSGAIATSGTIDMSGWTEDERMMYEHHGTLPARLQGAPSGNGGGMVGGC